MNFGTNIAIQEDNCRPKRNLLLMLLVCKTKSVIGRNANVIRPRNAVLKMIFDMDENLFTKHYRLCRGYFLLYWILFAHEWKGNGKMQFYIYKSEFSLDVNSM